MWVKKANAIAKAEAQIYIDYGSIFIFFNLLSHVGSVAVPVGTTVVRRRKIVCRTFFGVCL